MNGKPMTKKEFAIRCVDLDSAWKVIEEDREYIREETRAEVLKDHFKIGEDVEGEDGYDPGKWHRLKIVASASTMGTWMNPNFIRRPPKMRPMNREELKAAASQLDETTLRDAFTEDAARTVLIRSGCPTEVPE
jgi:hypothetical protein